MGAVCADSEDAQSSSVPSASAMALITPPARWFPQTLFYAAYTMDFPLFLRASQHKHFQNLAIITGIDNAESLRDAVKAGCQRLEVGNWNEFRFRPPIWETMHMDQLDTIR